jgi:hypothetical protein
MRESLLWSCELRGPELLWTPLGLEARPGKEGVMRVDCARLDVGLQSVRRVRAENSGGFTSNYGACG